MSSLGVERVCCLLHNLEHGGSARQWVHLLGRHVETGGTAAILAPDGPLAEQARSAGIEVIPTVWREEEASRWRGVTGAALDSDAAVVHWDHEVMGGFGPALEASGLAALSIHQAPEALARWFGREILAGARAPIDHALREPGAVVLVRGEGHRRRFAAAAALMVPPDRLRVLPASIPMPPGRFTPRLGEPREILALARLSPDKGAIQRLAIDLTRARLEAGRPAALRIAGNGPCRDDVVALCERALPRGSWAIEDGPADAIARLAAADVVVAQGLTTLEAAALGRRVVVARSAGGGAAGAVLRPRRYEEAAKDPFGEPELTTDAGRLWEEVLAVDEGELRELRRLVELDNGLDAAATALRDAFAETPRRRGARRALRNRLARVR
ncbi:MAG TPA: hypothetical protein VGF09_02080 [Solirubrobacterales bacterium]|jgi:hypothetical protein